MDLKLIAIKTPSIQVEVSSSSLWESCLSVIIIGGSLESP